MDDEAGMMDSVSTINKIIGEQIDKGIAPERVIVGGFSQGSVIAFLVLLTLPYILQCASPADPINLQTGLTSERQLGGIIALSSYLPLRGKIANMITDAGRKTPIFMAHGNRDGVVRYDWGERSKSALVGMGLDVTWKVYDGLEHSATPAEINDMEQWMDQRLKATVSKVQASV